MEEIQYLFCSTRTPSDGAKLMEGLYGMVKKKRVRKGYHKCKTKDCETQMGDGAPEYCPSCQKEQFTKGVSEK